MFRCIDPESYLDDWSNDRRRPFLLPKLWVTPKNFHGSGTNSFEN
jgi:hypothetical protein